MRRRYDVDAEFDNTPSHERQVARVEHGAARNTVSDTPNLTPNPWILGTFWNMATEVCAFRSGHFSELAYMAGRTDKHTARRYVTRRSTTHTR
jgi:hypothetical protein